MSYSEKHQEVSYDWHVLYTKYLERITSWEATNFTKEELADAEAWEKIKEEREHNLWVVQKYAIPRIIEKVKAVEGGGL